MTEFVNSITGFSTEGVIPNVFQLLEPWAKVASALKSLIGLAPIK